MNMGTISIVVKSVTDKMTSGIKGAINVMTQYSNSIDKATASMNKMANSTSSTDSGFAKSKQQIIDLEKELQNLTKEYDEHLKTFKDRPDFASYGIYNPTYNEKTEEYTSTDKNIRITQTYLDKEKAKINELKQTLKDLRAETEKPMEQEITTPKEATKGLKDIGDKAKDSRRKINLLSSSMRVLGSVSRSIGSKGFDFLKGKFSSFTKSFGKGVDNNIKQIKKFALGLIGVRTAMSILTKAVNAYLSFDSELQDSLTNSWNMLGSLLAPAIEFVARMFAIATNYVAQFVNALTGINLVARANAKALQTQAKENAKANKEMQRGLLGMDEITNLPTEPSAGGGGEAPQITMDDTIKSFEWLDKVLDDLKKGKWHDVGEDIADAINKLLYKINWKDLKQKAYKFGYNFADFLNGLFEVDWSKIGNTIAESFNTLIMLVAGFIDKFSFIQLGGGIARMLNHAFLDIDYYMLAETINTGIQKMGDGISVFLETFKWGDIGEKFGEFVAKIDWGGMLFEAIKNSILLQKGLSEFINGFFMGIVNELFPSLQGKFIDFSDWIFQTISDLMGNIFGVVSLLGDHFKNVFKTIVDVAKSLLKGDLLGVASAVGKGFINRIIIPINWLTSRLNNVIKPIMDILQAISEATGSTISFKGVKIPQIPTLATGTNEIKYEGLYHLHEGEAVVPKQYNPATGGYDNGADNKQIIDLLISLNSSMLEYAERPININMNSRKVAEATYDDMQQIDRTRNKSTAVVRS